MLFPKSATQKIADVFYDKTIDVLDSTEEIDSEGGIVRDSFTVKHTLKANIRFNALGELQSEIGLTENIDIAITCATGAPIAIDDLLEYQGVCYVATSVIPYDSHLMIVGRKWESQ